MQITLLNKAIASNHPTKSPQRIRDWDELPQKHK